MGLGLQVTFPNSAVQRIVAFLRSCVLQLMLLPEAEVVCARNEKSFSVWDMGVL